MEQNNDHKKIIEIILFALLCVVLCYLFVVIYFFCIDTCNINAKLAIWPFLSESAKTDQFASAVVDVSFEIENENHETEEFDTVGVNVHKNGYVVVMYDYFRSCEEDTQINIKTNSGQTLVGKIVFGDIRLNLAILKCQSPDGKDVNLPFLRIGNFQDLTTNEKVYAISSPLDTVSKHTMTIGSSLQIISEKMESNYLVVDYLMKDCKNLATDDDSDFDYSVVVNKSGKFVGISFPVSSETESTEESNNQRFCMMNGTYVDAVLSEVVNQKGQRFSSQIADNFHGFDKEDYRTFNEYSNNENGHGYFNGFYFEGKMEDYTVNSQAFSLMDLDGFFLFKDFVYKDETILSAGNVVTALLVGNGAKIDIATTEDFIYQIYKLRSGQRVTLNYVMTGEKTEQKQVSFVA